MITPNLDEAINIASACDDRDKSNINAIANAIYQTFAITSVIIKGGHNAQHKQTSQDFCLHQLNQLSDEKQDNQEKQHYSICYHLSAKRSVSQFSHGGGCSFATALSAFLAQGYLMRDAFTLAKAFITEGLIASEQQSALENHHYYGAFEQGCWPEDASYFPQVIDELSLQYQDLPAFNSLDLAGEKLGLYPVIDSIYWLKRLLPLGLEIIQLRLKNIAEHELAQLICEAVALAKPYKTRLFINDYWQLAIQYGAYGVHIGQEDLQAADLHAIQQAGLRLGVSTHGCYEFLLAQQLQPSYLAIGAIFPTTTKDMTGQIQGIDNLKQVLALRPQHKSAQIPVVAIGGINLARAPEVLATQVESIAVVTAITEADNRVGESAESAVKALKGLINPHSTS